MRDLLFDSAGNPAQARIFSTPAEDRLYQHTSGARVLADWDGPGVLEILEAPGETWLQSEHGICVLTEDHVKVGDHAVLYSSLPGPFMAVARSGPLPPGAPFEAADKSVQGCGWVMSAPGLTVDDLPIRLPPGIPLPFWRFCEAEQPLRVVKAAHSARLADQFFISDPAALKARGWKAQNMSDFYPLSSRDWTGAEREGIHAAHLNVASWQLTLPRPCRALLLRKVYDRFHGRQRARVMLNGGFSAWWYEPGEDRQKRWASSQVVATSPCLLEGGEVTISIDPPSGTALWDVAQYEIWTIGESM